MNEAVVYMARKLHWSLKEIGEMIDLSNMAEVSEALAKTLAGE